jgi:hypothetical protein
MRGRIHSHSPNKPTKPIPNTHSTWTFAQKTTRGTVQARGRHDRVARARSTSQTQAAKAAKENTYGLGSARGSMMSQPKRHAATVAAVVARTRHASAVSPSEAAMSSACAIWSAAPPARVHNQYAPRSKSHEV